MDHAAGGGWDQLVGRAEEDEEGELEGRDSVLEGVDDSGQLGDRAGGELVVEDAGVLDVGADDLGVAADRGGVDREDAG